MKQTAEWWKQADNQSP